MLREIVQPSVTVRFNTSKLAEYEAIIRLEVTTREISLRNTRDFLVLCNRHKRRKYFVDSMIVFVPYSHLGSVPPFRWKNRRKKLPGASRLVIRTLAILPSFQLPPRSVTRDFSACSCGRPLYFLFHRVIRRYISLGLPGGAWRLPFPAPSIAGVTSFPFHSKTIYRATVSCHRSSSRFRDITKYDGNERRGARQGVGGVI